MKKYLLAALVGAAFAIPSAALACSGCGCALDTDEAAIGTASGPGWSIDERIDYINQNTLWLGGGPAKGQDPTAGDQHEVQKNTTTVFFNTTLDYQSPGAWGVTTVVPVQSRSHSTYNGGTWQTSDSAWNAVGDVRVLGRYALTESKGFSLLGGVKLPTGGTKHSFDSGATPGTAVDRGLQPGTGTWDALLGASQKGQITDSLAWFAQELVQKPIGQHNNFSEGPKLNGSVGIRYAVNEVVTPQLQINAENRWRERGYNGDVINSSGKTVYASPGVFLNVFENTAVYGFVQVPVYQHTGGLQLVPDYSASLGIKYKF